MQAASCCLHQNVAYLSLAALPNIQLHADISDGWGHYNICRCNPFF